MKATEQYFPVVLFIMLHEVVLTFETVDVRPFKWKLLSSTDFPVVLFITLHEVVLTSECVAEILK